MKKTAFFVNAIKYSLSHLIFRNNIHEEFLLLKESDRQAHMTMTEHMMLYGLQEYGTKGLLLADIALFGLGVPLTLLLDIFIAWFTPPAISILIRCFAAVYLLHKFDFLRKTPEIALLELAFLAVCIINHFYVCLTYIFYFLFENMVVQMNNHHRRNP